MLIHCNALPLPHTPPPILRSAVNGKSAPSSAYKRKNTAPTTRARRDYYYYYYYYYSSSSYNKSINVVCGARRRARYEEEDGGGEEEYGHNDEIALLESYSESARDEALLVTAAVDGDDELLLIFKYSCNRVQVNNPVMLKIVTNSTATGVLVVLELQNCGGSVEKRAAGEAVIQSIDIVRGPFDPNNIQYLEKGLTWKLSEADCSNPESRRSFFVLLFFIFPLSSSFLDLCHLKM
uniref:DUF7734 domain-containing protein n=1 Tax=Ananas comosus var. bracteatus TaxID=296719 RepID=A0A6V7PPH1_ANACO|nr:unnamed protein product [Ananas comosus var. bracteatus]